MRCRTNAYEEVTQCHMRLRHGHPAAKCYEKDQVCSHCGRKGHKALDCPAAEADPTCVNCRGKHSARDKTCSARTAYLVGQVENRLSMGSRNERLSSTKDLAVKYGKDIRGQ